MEPGEQCAHARPAVCARPRAPAQAVVATRGMAAATEVAAEWLDDDLDVGGRAPAVAR